MKRPVFSNPAILSWVLYDLANSIYSTGVLSLYGSLWATKTLGASEAAYGATLSISMVLVAAIAPWVGAVSDRLRKRTPFVVAFTVLCCLATALMGFTGHALLGLVLLGISNFAYQIGAVPYNAQLPEIADPEHVGRVSGWGAGFNAFGATFVALVVPKLVAKSGGEIVRQSAFVPIALLFALFALPLALFTKDRNGGKVPDGTAPGRPASDRAGLARPPAPSPFLEPGGPAMVVPGARTPGWAETWRDVWEARKIPGVWACLAANLLIQDAGNTIVAFFALYCVNALGVSEAAGEPAKLMALAAIGGIVSGPIWGWACDKFGPRRAYLFDAALWILLFVGMPLITAKWAYFAFFGPGVGIAIAGTVAAQRPLLAELTPATRRGEYFGMLAMVGRVAAIIGPTTWGLITTALDDRGFIRYQAAMGSLLALTILGLFFLLRVPDTRAPGFAPPADPIKE